jgi:transcription initiation factor IIE alpha subunit
VPKRISEPKESAEENIRTKGKCCGEYLNLRKVSREYMNLRKVLRRISEPTEITEEKLTKSVAS